MRRTRMALVLLGWTAMVSCGDAGDAGGSDAGDAGGGKEAGGPIDMTPQGVCAFYAERDCANWERCTPYVFRNTINDAALCRERTTISCITRLTATGTNETSSSVAACAQALTDLSCDAFLDGHRRPPACAVPNGQRLDGASCIVHGQCSGGFCANQSRQCGVCRTVLDQGGACTSQLDCRNFMSCVKGVCTPHSRLGEPCDSELGCVDGYVCRNFDASAGRGTCAVGLPAGATCDPSSDECDYVHEGVACDLFMMTCQRNVSPKTGDNCELTGFCNSTAACVDSVCRELPREGKPCSLQGGSPECLTPARCIEGICRLRDDTLCP